MVGRNPVMAASVPTFLFTVADRLELQGRGLVLVPGVPWEHESNVKEGDGLILRLPLGEVMETTSRDLEMVNWRPDGMPNKATPILLGKNIHKADVPIGTEVFLARTPVIDGNVDQNSGDHGRDRSHPSGCGIPGKKSKESVEQQLWRCHAGSRK